MGCGRLVAGRERAAGRRAGSAARPRPRRPARRRPGRAGGVLRCLRPPPPARLRSTPQPGPAGARHAALAGAPAALRPTASTNGADEHFGGGRFDSTPSDPYPFLYAASTDTTALAEVFLRGLPFDDRGARILPRKLLAGRRLSRVELIGEVTRSRSFPPWTWPPSAKMSGWSRPRRPPMARPGTGPTGCAVRRPGRRSSGRSATCPSAAVLFGDRCPPGLLQAVPDPPPEDLDSVDGALLLRRLLAPYGVTVRLPPTVLATS